MPARRSFMDLRILSSDACFESEVVMVEAMLRWFATQQTRQSTDNV